MTFEEYQNKVAATDAPEISKNTNLSIPLLGLAGETRSLLTLYKKWLRDGDAYQIVEDRLSEEMGDILWYLNLHKHFSIRDNCLDSAVIASK